MMFKSSVVSALALLCLTTTVFAQETDSSGNVVIGGNLVDGACAIDYDPEAGIDYFPTKYAKPNIASYNDIDIFGNKFVPHNTTDFLNIEYFDTYKIVTNSHQSPPVSYLLYQCGTDIPDDVNQDDYELVVSVPHQGGLALTQTPQIPYVELLNLRKEVIALIGDPQYVTSPCMSYQLGEDASDEERIPVIWDSNSTIDEEMVAQWRADNPDAIIVSGPTNNIVGDRVIIASATQERTNVATYDWIAFYGAFYNLEGESNRLTQQMQDSYDCTSDVANEIVAEQRALGSDVNTDDPEYKEPVIFWANFFTWGGLGWSVAECPTWDTSYQCEYATHCGATVLSRPEGVGYNQTYGDSPTLFWYLSDEEAMAMGKDADIFMYSGSDWDGLYESHGEMLDQFKSVQNKQVFDTLGQGPSAWHEQRYAEYDIVGLDMCDVVGHSVYQFGDDNEKAHERRWFRNVYTDPVGSLPECDVAGGAINQAYVAPDIGCVRPMAQGITSENVADIAAEAAAAAVEAAAALLAASENSGTSTVVESEESSNTDNNDVNDEDVTNPPYDWDRGTKTPAAAGSSLSMGVFSFVAAIVVAVL